MSQVAVVTGTARGIGLELCRHLLRRDATVVADTTRPLVFYQIDAPGNTLDFFLRHQDQANFDRDYEAITRQADQIISGLPN